MLKLILSGVILLGIASCKNSPTLSKPVEMFAVSLKFNEAAKGDRNLNYKAKKHFVGEWIDSNNLEFLPLTEIPQELQCFSQRTWLTVVKPKLKQASDYYHRK